MSVSGTEVGCDLVAEWSEIEERLVPWILKLAEFDRDALWSIDGFHNCVSWLEIKCGMARPTAYEKVRVAKELGRRPFVREAFVDGELPYSKVRLLVTLDGLNDERDERFVADAAHITIRKLEERVRDWNFAHRDDPKPNLDDHYGMRLASGFMDGYGQLILEGPNDMLARVLAIADAYGNFLFHNQPTQLRLDGTENYAVHNPADDAEPKRPTSAKRLDYLLDLLEEIALVNDDKVDPETATIGVTVAYQDLINNTRTLIPTEQGVVVTGEAVRRLACDAGIVRFVTNGASELLDIGRKSRRFTTAQRRAIRALWGYRCPFPGCNRRAGQIHHLQWWSQDGPTGVTNGIPPCGRHHHCLHEGEWDATWTPRGTLLLTAPDGQTHEITPPGLRRAVA